MYIVHIYMLTHLQYVNLPQLLYMVCMYIYHRNYFFVHIFRFASTVKIQSLSISCCAMFISAENRWSEAKPIHKQTTSVRTLILLFKHFCFTTRMGSLFSSTSHINCVTVLTYMVEWAGCYIQIPTNGEFIYMSLMVLI